MKHFLVLILLFFMVYMAHADSRRAFRLLEKKKYDKLEKHLDKSLEKDTINPGAKYVYSLLYLTEDYKHYDIDTAYMYINEALDDLAYLDERDLDKLERLDITDTTIQQQKDKVEDHAYRRARKKHTLETYNYFIERFGGASETDSAIYHRNALAFKRAEEKNTYQAFQDFIYTYPTAVQIEKAREKYNQLLFRSQTSDGRLETYIRFLRNNPNTPYRINAEQNILEIKAADNKIENYIWFLDQYPNSAHRKEALNFLYHNYKEQSGVQAFLNRFGFLQEGDSIVQIAKAELQTMIPVYDKTQYGFMNNSGDLLIDYHYDSIQSELLCGNIKKDVLEVFDGSKKTLVSRLGDTIYSGSYDHIEDIGFGLIRIEKDSMYGLLHKSGKLMLDIDFDGIERLGASFIKIKIGDKWGLVSYAGRAILPVQYDAIDEEGSFIIVKEHDYLAVTNINTLKKAAEGIKPQLFFAYDDYMMMDDHHVLAFTGNSEVLINEKLENKSRTENHEIHDYFGGWLVKSPAGYRVYDLIFYPLSDEFYLKAKQNKNNLAIQRRGKWGIYNVNGEFPEKFEYDSVRFLSENITLLTKQDTVWASFFADTLINISEYENIKVLQPQLNQTAYDSIPGYLLVSDGRNAIIFNQFGKNIIDGRFSDAKAVGLEYLVLTYRGREALYHKSGEQLLDFKYEAIGNYKNGYVSTLINGKFGIYNYHKNIFLSAKHEKLLRPYGEQLFISTKSNNHAIVDLDNEFVSEFDFETIHYWNDTAALVKQAEYWAIYDIANQELVYDKIELMEWLKQGDGQQLLLITKNSKEGVISNDRGEIIDPTFNDIYNIGTTETQVFFAEKYIPEAAFYIVIYYTNNGKIIKKQVFTEEEYWKIYCEG